MKSTVHLLIHIYLVQFIVFLCASKNFDFFYFVQQWPGAFCDKQTSCCYPTTGKPAANFTIHGLWPNRNDGSYPSNCDPKSLFDFSQVSNLTSEMQTEWPSLACPSGNGTTFWAHEWNKHGTCSESILTQHYYFASALKLKQKVDLLGALNSTGIRPYGAFYSISSIQEAIGNSTGFSPGIECNADESGTSQLYQIYLCVDTSGSNFIECPVLPRGECTSQIKFPQF